jgi:hypothetical protein
MNTETPDTPPSTLHLLSCLRHEPAKDKAARLHEISPSDWPFILTEADRHEVAPLLYFAVKPHARNLSISLDLMTAMRRKYLIAVARNLHLFQELSSLLNEFNRERIPVVLLKGAHLAGEVYDDMGLRNMCDIDLLVRRADLMRVEQLLLSRGADPEDRRRVIGSDNKHFGYQLAESGLRVEIHWALVTGDSCKIEWEETESRLRPIAINSVPALALCPEDLLLHLCLHAAGHLNALHVRMLCDMVAVGQKYGTELDWPGLVARAEIWGASRAAYVMLRLARERLGAPLAADWIEALRTEDMEEEVVSSVAGRFFNAPHLAPPDLSIGMARFRTARGLKARMKYLATRVFVSPEIMAFKYGAPSHSWRILLFYPARLMDLWRRHGRFLGQTMFGGRKTQAAANRISKKSQDTDKLRDWLLSRVS